MPGVCGWVFSMQKVGVCTLILKSCRTAVAYESLLVWCELCEHCVQEPRATERACAFYIHLLRHPLQCFASSSSPYCTHSSPIPTTEGWMAEFILVGATKADILSSKWSPANRRWGAGQGKSAGQRPTS